MSGLVWMSTAFGDPRHLRPFIHDRTAEDIGEEKRADRSRRYLVGEPLNDDEFPTVIWGAADRGARNFKSLPDLFYGFGFWVVSQRCANVMRQFDLGRGGLYPVKVFQKDKKTPIGDHEWFCLNFGNAKSAFKPEQSRNVKPWPQDTWGLGYVMRDDDIAVGTNALQGPDIWIDPQLHKAFFLSGPLGVALKKAKATSGFGLKKCRVV